MLVPGPRFWSEGPLGERYSSGGGVSINERGTGLQLRASEVRSVVRSSMLHDTSEHQAQSSVHIILGMRSRETACSRSEGNENLDRFFSLRSSRFLRELCGYELFAEFLFLYRCGHG